MADKELTEISKKTLKSYLDKAWASYNKNEKLSNLSLKMNDGEKSDLHTRIADKRYRNFHKAINKIAKIKESSELEEKAPPLTRFQKLKKAVHNSTKDLPGGPMTKAATLAGIEGAAAGAGYAIWGLPGAAISGTYGLYQGYKALKGAYDSIKEDVSDEDIISSMLTLYEIRVKYEDIKEDLEDKDFQLFLDEGFDTDEIADFFSSDPEEWDPLFESIDQLDEISKKTLGNYLTYKEIRHRYDDKDHYDAQQKRDRAYQAVNNARNDAYSDLTQDQKDSLWSASNKISNEKHAAEKKFERKAKNSYHGTINAVNRLQGKFAGKKIIDEPEVRSPKKGYLTKPEKSHIEYKDYKAESVEDSNSGVVEDSLDEISKETAKRAYQKAVHNLEYGSNNWYVYDDQEKHSVRSDRLGSHLERKSGGTKGGRASPGNKARIAAHDAIEKYTNQHETEPFKINYQGKPNYTKKTLTTEDINQIDEISKGVLARYISGRYRNSAVEGPASDRQYRKSERGIYNATNRLQGKFAHRDVRLSPEEMKNRGPRQSRIMSKRVFKDYKAESVELEESDLNNRSRKIFMNPKMANMPLEGNVAGIGNKGDNAKIKKQMKEDTEINEISKKTLGSYIKKAAVDMAVNRQHYGATQADYEHRWDQLNRQDHNAPYEVKKALNDTKNTLTKSHNKKQSEISNKSINREIGIGRAVDRMQSNFSSVKVDKTDSNGDIIKVPKKYNEDIDYKVELESIVRSSLEGDASDIKGRFESLLQDKISDVLDAKRDIIAYDIFDKENQVEEDVENIDEISRQSLERYVNGADYKIDSDRQDAKDKNYRWSDVKKEKYSKLSNKTYEQKHRQISKYMDLANKKIGKKLDDEYDQKIHSNWPKDESHQEYYIKLHGHEDTHHKSLHDALHHIVKNKMESSAHQLYVRKPGEQMPHTLYRLHTNALWKNERKNGVWDDGVNLREKD